MSLTKSSFASIPTCYATVSVGTTQQSLREKLEAIANAGFQGIELGFPDLLNWACKYHDREVDDHDWTSLSDAAKVVRKWCEKHNLKVVMLQPFSNFEGWPADSEERKDAFRRAKGWITIMKSLECDMLQVGSTDTPNINTSPDALASDLRELCDILAKHDYRLAYENWCWSTHAPDWKDVWALVQKVDRPNIGLCLDTFQTAGGEWADPTTKSGLIENVENKAVLEKRFQASLENLSKTIPAEKIYILQISDAYKPKKPLDPKPDKSGLRPRGRWSSCLRPVPFNGGYLPVVDVTKAVLRTGFRGWFSMEVFDGGPDGSSQEWDDMPGYTKKAMISHNDLLDKSAEE
ncbi:hypothetical protein G7Y79_00025g057370 [Physcia stellaris]|nr:hypothetical protein G7Y79_00025g057370 [Physcia stellaris]